MTASPYPTESLPEGLRRLMEAGVIATPEQVFDKQLREFWSPRASEEGSPGESLPMSLTSPEVTSGFESEEVTYGHIQSPESPARAREATQPPPTPHCAATNRKGDPCKAYPSLGTSFCLMHNPERAEYVSENRRQGGRHRAPYRFHPETETNFDAIELNLFHPADFQASLEAILRMVLLGRIPARNAAIVMRFFEVAARTFPHLKGQRTEKNYEIYGQQVARLLHSADLIEDHLSAQRTQERIESLSDTRSRYEERFRTEDHFGRGPKPR